MTGSVPEGDREMYAGLVGQVIETFAPHTEAHPVSIAAHFVVAFGNAVGSGTHFVVGETLHRMNEFLLVVGKSSRARKGDARNTALRSLEIADPGWLKDCVASGLSSAEGLIYHVRDAVMSTDEKGQTTVVDKGSPLSPLPAKETVHNYWFLTRNAAGYFVSWEPPSSRAWNWPVLARDRTKTSLSPQMGTWGSTRRTQVKNST